MGNTLAQGEVRGWYGYNTFADSICCCYGHALCSIWTTNCCCDGSEDWDCDPNSTFKHDPAWAPNASLRTEFEKALGSAAMYEAMDAAEKVCKCLFGGCSSPVNQVQVLNAKFCPAINDQLLHNAGYDCYAKYWVTTSTSSKGQTSSSSHMAIVIQAWKPGDPTGERFLRHNLAYMGMPGMPIRPEMARLGMVRGMMQGQGQACVVPFSDLKTAVQNGPLVDENFRCRSCGQVAGHQNHVSAGGTANAQAQFAPQPQFSPLFMAQPPQAHFAPPQPPQAHFAPPQYPTNYAQPPSAPQTKPYL